MKFAAKWSSYIYHVLDDCVPGLYGTALCGKTFNGDELNIDPPHYYRMCITCKASTEGVLEKTTLVPSRGESL